jgi:DNA polymerase I
MTTMPNGFDVRGRLLQDGELAAWLAEHSLGNRFGVAVHVRAPKAVAVAIVAADGDGRYIDTARLAGDDEEALASWLADPGPPKAVHDAKLTTRALGGRGWALRGIASDTASAAHLLCPGAPNVNLNDLLVRHMRCALPAEAAEPQRFSTLDDDQAVRALILRACAVLDLADVLDEELARIDSSSLLNRLELPVSQALAGLETVGIAIRPAGPLNSTAPDGRIHPTYHPTGAAGGGIMTSDPDLHALPLSGRDAVVAGKGYAELMVARYPDIEARVVAHLTDEGTLLDDGGTGYRSTLLGRRRYPPAAGDSHEAALSFVVDGSVADIVKTALVNVDATIKAAGLRSRLVAQTGDELVLEVAAGEREALAAHVGEQMREANPLDAPLDVVIGCGPDWGAATQAAQSPQGRSAPPS